MYRIAEIAEKLGKSKTAIYNKLNENQGLFKEHLKKVENVKMLDKEGVELLEELFGLKEVEGEVENKQGKSSNKEDSINVEMLVNELKDRIEYLEEENREARQLLKDQNKQLENFQVLLLNEQKRNKLLEGKIEKSQAEKEMAVATEEKVGFFQRWLRKRGK